MRVSASSNVVGAIYLFVFDVLLQCVLVQLSKIFLSGCNLKRIYEDRKPVGLVTSRCSLFIDQGTTPRGYGRSVAIFRAAVLALATAGSFAFGGFSEVRTVEKIVSTVVDIATERNVIDYTAHVQRNGDRIKDVRISGAFLLASSAVLCIKTDGPVIKTYSAVNNIPYMNEIQFTMFEAVGNTSCRMESFGFKDKEAFRILKDYNWLSFLTEECKYYFEPNLEVEIAKAKSFSFSNCSFEVLEVWCASSFKPKCIGLTKHASGFTTMSIDYEIGRNGNTLIARNFSRLRFHMEMLDNRMLSLSLRSTAFLSSMDLFDDQVGRSISMLSFMYNAPVEVMDGTSNKTNVDLWLLNFSAVPALGMVLLFAITAFRSWAHHVSKPKRSRYNTFYSVGDWLSCAVVEISQRSSCRFRNRGTLVVGMVENGTHVKPVAVTETESVIPYREDKSSRILLRNWQ